MTNAQFKKALQLELQENVVSFRNPIKEVCEVGVNTCIVFSYPVDDNTKEWLNRRFMWGVTIANIDNERVIFVNTPLQGKKA